MTRHLTARIGRATQRAASLAAIATTLLAPAHTAAAQSAPPLRDGFRSSAVWVETGSPWGVAGFARDANGDLWIGHRHQLLRFDRSAVRHVERSFPIGAQLGLIAWLAATNELCYSRFDTGELWRRDLATGGERRATLPRNTFDLALGRGGQLLLSANPDWPAPGARAGVFVLDDAGSRRIANVTGPSGPIAVEPRGGDLLYAVQSDSHPTPPGAVRLLRFPAARIDAAIAGGTPLQESDASVVVAGLDGAYDLAFDDRGTLHVSDPRHGDVRRIDVRAGRIDATACVLRGPRAALQLQFVDVAAGVANATFDPHQPDHAGAMLVATSDFTSESAVHAITPVRPVLDVPPALAGPGVLRIALRGLPPSRGAVVFASLLPLLPERALLTLDGVPAWFALDFALPAVAFAAVADANGDARVDVPSPGGFDLWLALQAAGVTSSPGGVPIAGTSAAAIVRITP